MASMYSDIDFSRARPEPIDKGKSRSTILIDVLVEGECGGLKSLWKTYGFRGENLWMLLGPFGHSFA